MARDKISTSSDDEAAPSSHEQDRIDVAFRGREVQGHDIFRPTTDTDTIDRVTELIAQMHADQPKVEGGIDMVYGDMPSQHLRLWPPVRQRSQPAPVIVYVHGGAWCSGTHLDSIGSLKVKHLTEAGYYVASINFSLVPSVTVEEQTQEVANACGYLIAEGSKRKMGYHGIVLLGHSSGAHVVALLGTDTTYFSRARFDMDDVRGVVAIDGSDYNAMAEFYDSPGPVANNLKRFVGTDITRLRNISPSCHASGRNAASFLLLHARRVGDIRQAVEFEMALRASGTDCALHVFEGEGFEGHMQILLRLGDDAYPATKVLDEWLQHIAAAR